MILDNLWNSAGISSATDLSTQRDAITNEYGSYLLSEVKTQLQNDSSLSNVKKYIISDEEAYLCILLISTKDGNGAFRPFSDAIQMSYSVKMTLNETENLYISLLIDNVLASNSIDLNANSSAIFSATLIKTQIQNELKRTGVDLANPDGQVMLAYQISKDFGPYNYIVECYLNTGEVETNNVDQSMKDEMAKYLFSLNLNLSTVAASIGPNSNNVDVFIDNNVDGYLAQAWSHALRVASGDDDPISQVYGQGLITPWDYSVDLFDDIEDIEIIPTNILAAGALYYIYWLDELGIFEAVDMIVMLWMRGSLSIPQGEASTMIYRYYKKRDDRMTKEERAISYRQAFGLGNASVIQGGMENTNFKPLMDNLMNQVVEYIHKIEGLDSGQGSVSIEGLSQSIRDLQYNISSNIVGMVQQGSQELHAQLQECINILRHPEIVAQLAGGRQRNMWTVLERVLKEYLKRPANISAAKTVAVEGNKMFSFIAKFDHFRRHSINYSPLLTSAEASIIAQSQLNGNQDFSSSSIEDSMADFAEVLEDDFDNWD